MEELSAGLRGLWKSRYSETSEDEFRFILEFCERNNFNVWGKAVYPKFRDFPGAAGGRTMELELTIESIRCLAHRTSQYDGNEVLRFEYDDKGQVTSSTATAYRVTNGRRARYEATVYLADADQRTGLWLTRPRTMLGKCAEAAVLREAFPEQFGGIYVEGELPTRMTSGSQSAEDIEKNGVAPDENTPSSQMQFELRLIHDFGFGKPHDRAALVRAFSEKYPHLADEEPRLRFYATVLYHLSIEPAKYGAKIG